MRAARSRTARLLLLLVGVAALVTVTVVVLVSGARHNRADDPRSTLPTGAAALAQLLREEGVRVSATSDPDQVAERSTVATTVVVANPDLLTGPEAARIAQAPHARLVLLRPGLLGLRAFGAGATTTTPTAGPASPGCADPAATRAGAVAVEDARAGYRTDGTAQLACYPAGDGHRWLRVPATGGAVDLVAGGLGNASLGEAGNAAFGMNLLGSRPEVLWLVAVRSDDSAGRDRPTLLPPWWPLALTQAAVALVAVGVWRGRRLGPILLEPLPVRVRGAETVEGHGRLYHRITARDRAAEALRRGARQRLGARYGHPDDPELLGAALADRTGLGAAELRELLAGPVPASDDELVALARNLDRLEQEARLR